MAIPVPLDAVRFDTLPVILCRGPDQEGAPALSLSRVGLISVAIVAAIAGAYALVQAIDQRVAPPIVIEDAAATFPIVIDIRGAVENPGVYELPPGARMQDAVDAAGGLTQNADLSTVNLARRLRDAEVVFVVEIATAGGSTPGPQLADSGFSEETSTPRININTASISELDVLPGIGEVTAGRIVEFREQNGPFRSVDDLVHVQGISTRTIENLRDLVTTAP
jgi:competence protein ComEA